MQPQFLSYREIRRRMQRHPLRQTEIPTEYEVSLAVPTCRWGKPAYAFFASPVVRRFGQPSRQGPPDRWWAFNAFGGQLLAYNFFDVVPFATEFLWTEVEVFPPAKTVTEIRQLLTDIETMADSLTPDFFGGIPGDIETRQALAKVLRQFLPEPVAEQYRALGPDFFLWLDR
jgi:hypothetical protein